MLRYECTIKPHNKAQDDKIVEGVYSTVKDTLDTSTAVWDVLHFILYIYSVHLLISYNDALQLTSSYDCQTGRSSFVQRGARISITAVWMLTLILTVQFLRSGEPCAISIYLCVGPGLAWSKCPLWPAEGCGDNDIDRILPPCGDIVYSPSLPWTSLTWDQHTHNSKSCIDSLGGSCERLSTQTQH